MHCPAGDIGELDFAGQARRLREAGCDGMKMIEGKPTSRKQTGLPLDSLLYAEYYAYLGDRAVPDPLSRE